MNTSQITPQTTMSSCLMSHARIEIGHFSTVCSVFTAGSARLSRGISKLRRPPYGFVAGDPLSVVRKPDTSCMCWNDFCFHRRLYSHGYKRQIEHKPANCYRLGLSRRAISSKHRILCSRIHNGFRRYTIEMIIYIAPRCRTENSYALCIELLYHRRTMCQERHLIQDIRSIGYETYEHNDARSRVHDRLELTLHRRNAIENLHHMRQPTIVKNSKKRQKSPKQNTRTRENSARIFDFF